MKRLHQADFIRVVSTLGIFSFHFLLKAQENGIISHNFLLFLPNFTLGGLFVTVFFMLSGAMLYYTSKEKPLTPARFYKRRFLGIFPAFYLAFFPLHIKTALEQHHFFYKGNPALFLLSLVGMDGYLSYRLPTYYQVGEWFLGALILLYLLYPLLHKGINLHPILTGGIVLLLYGSTYFPSLFQIDRFQNLFSCLLSFWVGMFFMKYQDLILEQKKCGWLSGFLLFFLLTVNIPGGTNFLSHLGGFCCFSFLYTIGSCLSENGKLVSFLRTCSTLSYPFYLVHHVILSTILNRISGTLLSQGYLLILFLMTLGLTFLVGWGIHIIPVFFKYLFFRRGK